MGSTRACTNRVTCPRIFETERGTVIVQGYALARPDGLSRLVKPPDGELQIEMPRAMFLALARSLKGRGGEPGADLDLFEGWEQSVFRLETLPIYLDEYQSEHCQAWLADRPLPPWSAETRAWFDYVSQTTQAGRRWQRVHVLSRPLNDYLRYELTMYSDTERFGYETLIADREGHTELDALTSDFYLFDGDGDYETAFAILMHYDDDGRFLGMWRTDDPPVLETCRSQRDLALAAAVPLEKFTFDRPVVRLLS